MKYNMMQQKRMEFIWRGSKNYPGKSGEMFTHLLDQSTYESTRGFFFDTLDPPVNQWNVRQLATT
jgi:hypothetical protein